ncbi:shikimate dehydrogenase family protein [Pelagibacterium halotolerans]|uniref:shikimate dehydrogenase family protein n=1 Tax=Pelagibacterium halotolerans TaxID=531813 RepID=UPI00384F00DD
MTGLQLGLIGDNIASSRAPHLHRHAGAQHGVAVVYRRLVPRDLGLSFDEVFAACGKGAFRGINVTYPYKERAAERVAIDDDLVRGMGAVNTVLFETEGAKGYNTDYTGFVEAYRKVRGDAAPGETLLIGTGGVGRAAAFALAALGATAIRLVDKDPARADRLAEDLQRAVPGIDLSVWTDVVKAASGADGLVNCTPVGMAGLEGTPLPREAMRGAAWAFDAVYTPPDTRFLSDARAEGLVLISGWELFFFQGVHAWTLFSGLSVDTARLRDDLLSKRADP